MDELRERLARGDAAAFAELYDACADRLHHYLTARLGARDEADDVLQETFVRLVRTRQRLRRVEDLTAYVFATARNEAARHGGRKAREGRRRDSVRAASFLRAVGLNVALDRAQAARLAALYGPEPVPQALADVTRTVEQVADARTAAWFRNELRGAARRPARDDTWTEYYSRTLR